MLLRASRHCIPPGARHWAPRGGLCHRVYCRPFPTTPPSQEYETILETIHETTILLELLGFTRILLDLLGFTRMLLDLLGFTRIYENITRNY